MHVSSILRRAIRWGLVASAPLAILQAHADLFVTSQSGPARGVLRYNQANGSFAGVFASFGQNADPLGMAFGPDGNLYVADGTENEVLRYNGRTGAYLGVFASGVQAPINLAFGPDGNLYVSSSFSQVVRFNGSTGASMGTFISDTRLAYPRGLTFGPDGNLYVVSYNNASVLRYSPAGTFLNTFVAPRSGGLFTPDDLLFGPDGNLYVTGGTFPNAGVMRYNGTTGAFLGQFASAGANNAPIDMAYGPDGNLYVTVGGAENAVLRFNGQTGALIDHFVTSGSGGLQNPFGIAFSPVPEPSTVALLAAATGFMLARRRR
jgi:DNA-binding beta-propeller fold protein YncE